MPKELKGIFEYVVKLLSVITLEPLKKAQKFLDKIKKMLDPAGLIPLIKKQAKSIQALLMNKPSAKNDYVKLRRHYVAKKLIALLVVICIIAPIVFYIYALPIIIQRFGTATFKQDSENIKGYTGKVKIVTQKEWLTSKGLIYKGRLKDGLYFGEGELYDKDNTLIYKGNFLDGLFNDQGTLYDKDGNIDYKGTFINGLKDGAGIEYHTNSKSKYEGTFKCGNYEGTGTEYYFNGNKKYMGTFATGKYSGNGTLYAEQGYLLYEGQFEGGKYSGQGTLYNDGRGKLYEGGFRNGLYQGSGKLYYENSQPKYIGNFESDKYWGMGTLFDENQSVIYEGEFIDGVYHGKGKLYKDGKVYYEGEFVKGVRYGLGKLYDTSTNTLSYEGEFQNDQYNGKGKLYSTDGKVIYDGVFANGSIGYGYLLKLPVEDIIKILGKASEASIPEDSNEYYIVSNDLKICIRLDLNSSQTGFESQEVMAWGQQNVFGIEPGMSKKEIDENLGSELYSGEEPVSPELKSALIWLDVDNVYAALYSVDNYLVTFYFTDPNSPWLYASIELGGISPIIKTK